MSYQCPSLRPAVDSSASLDAMGGSAEPLRRTQTRISVGKPAAAADRTTPFHLARCFPALSLAAWIVRLRERFHPHLLPTNCAQDPNSLCRRYGTNLGRQIRLGCIDGGRRHCRGQEQHSCGDFVPRSGHCACASRSRSLDARRVQSMLAPRDAGRVVSRTGEAILGMLCYNRSRER